MPWYASNREFETLPYCDIALYTSVEELKERFAGLIRTADVVVVGSYVPDGIAVGRWVTSLAKNATAFYDIDTPVTLANLANRHLRVHREGPVSQVRPIFFIYRWPDSRLH